MAYLVTISSTKHQFKVEDDESILQAALAAGLVIPYGCRDGACGSCKGKLIEGRIDYGNYSQKALSDEERAAGSALFCQAKPLSDVVIEPRSVRAAGDIQVRILPSRLTKIERVTEDVVILYLKLPATERFHPSTSATPMRTKSGCATQNPSRLRFICAMTRSISSSGRIGGSPSVRA